MPSVLTALRHGTKWHAPAHLAVVIISLQGAPIISQFLVSLIVPLAVIGSIRTAESALPVVILFTSLGASSLAVREVAAAHDDESRRATSSNLLLLPIVGMVLAFLISLVMLSVAPAAWASHITLALPLLPLALLININRCIGGIAQGWGKTAAISMPVAIGSLIAISCHLAGACIGALSGWIAGRYVAEIVVLLCFLSISSRARWSGALKLVEGTHFARLAGSALILNMSFVLRAAADALPLLSLADQGGAVADVGAFGIATLIMTMAMLPIGILSQFTLPALSRAAATQQKSARTAIIRLMALGAAGLILLGGASLLASDFLPEKFKAPAFFTAILALSLPLKAGATGYGTRLIAARRFNAPLVANGIEISMLLLILAGGATPLRSAFSVIVGAALSLASLAWLDHRPMRRI